MGRARATCLTRRRRSVAQDRFAAAKGGARGLEKCSNEAGLKAGGGVGTSSARSLADNPPEDSTGSCPCAKKWQTGQISAALLEAVALSCAGCRVACETASDPWPEPGNACKHGPHSMIAAWNVTTVATRIRLRIRGITFDLDPFVDSGGEQWSRASTLRRLEWTFPAGRES
jgi:hypothetical protein